MLPCKVIKVIILPFNSEAAPIWKIGFSIIKKKNLLKLIFMKSGFWLNKKPLSPSPSLQSDQNNHFIFIGNTEAVFYKKRWFFHDIKNRLWNSFLSKAVFCLNQKPLPHCASLQIDQSNHFTFIGKLRNGSYLKKCFFHNLKKHFWNLSLSKAVFCLNKKTLLPSPSLQSDQNNHLILIGNSEAVFY